MSGKKKYFVLDTNVILHDPTCISQFKDNDVVIPIIVLEELDNFKKGNEMIHFNARQFMRKLDAHSNQSIFNGGVSLGPGLGKIIIRFDKEFHKDLSFNFDPEKPDHKILNAAYQLSKEDPERQVVLVTKDVNFRMKAKAMGIRCMDYLKDHVPDLSELYNGHRALPVDMDTIEKLHGKDGLAATDLPISKPLQPSEYIELSCGETVALAVCRGARSRLYPIEATARSGIFPRNTEQAFALDALSNFDTTLVSVTGKAGTGKTLLALAAALENIEQYQQIFLARPVIPLSGKDIGFLPGDIQSKIAPYMQPLYDNLNVIKQQSIKNGKKAAQIKEWLKNERLVIAPLAYIRGRSLNNVYFICDESQNLTPHEVKTIITRAGEGTKMVFTGDIFQIDHPYLESQTNGLSYLINKMKGQRLYAHINLEKGERSALAELASNVL